MTRMATVTVLQRHSNEHGGTMQKIPAAEADGAAGLTSYALPLGEALTLEHQGLVRIDATDPDPETESEEKPKASAPKKAKAGK